MDSEPQYDKTADKVKKVKVKAADKKEVQAKWMDMQLARKNFDYVAAIFRHSMPKVIYSKRKNGKKVRLNNTKGHKDSKYMQWFGAYMQAGMLLKQAEQAFSDALAGQEKKSKGSIKAILDEQAPKAVA